jgi:hypothetical protein
VALAMEMRAQRARRRWATVAIGIALWTYDAGSARAQHAGDMLVASTAAGGGALAIAYDFAREVQLSESFTGGGVTLWSATDPGWDALRADDPARSLFRLADGTQVRIEITAIHGGCPPSSAQCVRVKVGSQTLDAVGESAVLGTMPDVHIHPEWTVALPTGVRGLFTVSFRVTARSSAYASSASYTAALDTGAEPTPTPTATSAPPPTPLPSSAATPTTTPKPASPTPSKSATPPAPTPTATSARPTPTSPSPTSSPSPTHTPRATAAPSPVATPIRTPAATATPSPAPTSTPATSASPRPKGTATPGPAATPTPGGATRTPVAATPTPIAMTPTPAPRLTAPPGLARVRPAARGDQVLAVYDARDEATTFLNLSNAGAGDLTLEIALYGPDLDLCAVRRTVVPAGGTRTLDVASLREDRLPAATGLAIATAIDNAGRPVTSGALGGTFTIADLATGAAWGAPALARSARRAAGGTLPPPGTPIDGDSVRLERLEPPALDLAAYYGPAAISAQGGATSLISISFDDGAGAPIEPIAMPTRWRLRAWRGDGAVVANAEIERSGVAVDDLPVLLGPEAASTAGRARLTASGPRAANRAVFFVQSLGGFASGYALPAVD